MSLLLRAEAILKTPRPKHTLTLETRSQSLEDIPEAILDIEELKQLGDRPKTTQLLLPSGKVFPGRMSPSKQLIETAGIAIPQGINLLTGSPGAGKTVFAVQFLVEGMQKGEHAVYLSFEEKKENFFKYAKGFGWDLASYEQQQLFTFIRYTPENSTQMLDDAVALGKHVTRVAIDSLTAFAILQKDELSAKESLAQLIETVQKWHATTLLLAEESPNSGDGIPLAVDGIVALYNFRTRNVRQRIAQLFHAEQLLPYKIDDAGISFSPEEALNLNE